MARTGRPKKKYASLADKLHAAQAADRRAIMVARNRAKETAEWKNANTSEKNAILKRIKEDVLQEREYSGLAALYVEQEIQTAEERKKMAETLEKEIKTQKDLSVAKDKQKKHDQDLKTEIAALYKDNFLPVIKYLEHRIFHKEANTMTQAERSEFLQNILDPEGIQDPDKAYLPKYKESDSEDEEVECSNEDMDVAIETKNQHDSGEDSNKGESMTDEDFSEWEGIPDD